MIREKSAWPSFCSRTTVTREWLAEKLQMRSAANVSQLLRRAVVKRRNRQVPSRFADFINRAIQAAESERECVKICTLTPIPNSRFLFIGVRDLKMRASSRLCLTTANQSATPKEFASPDYFGVAQSSWAKPHGKLIPGHM